MKEVEMFLSGFGYVLVCKIRVFMFMLWLCLIRNCVEWLSRENLEKHDILLFFMGVMILFINSQNYS